MGQDNYQRINQNLAVQPSGYFYATRGVGKRVALGLPHHAVWLPHQMAQHLKRPLGYSGKPPPTYFVQPTVSFRLNDNFSAGVRVVYAFGKYTQRRALGQYDAPTAQAQLSSSGSGLGLNTGLYGRTGDNLAFSISYRSGGQCGPCPTAP